MKNLSINKKLFLGFGIACVLMIIFGVVTFYTSVTRNGDLDKLNELTNFQAEIRFVNTDVLSATVELRTVYTSADGNDDEYTKALEYLASAKKHLAKASELNAAKLDDDYDDEIAAMTKALNELEVANTNIQASNQSVRSQSAAFVANGKETTQSAVNFVEYLLNNQLEANASLVTHVMGGGDFSGDISTFTRRSGFLQQGISIDAEIAELRLSGQTLAADQDLTVAGDIKTRLDAINTALTTLYEATQTERTRAMVDEIRAAMVIYQSEADKIIAEVTNNQSLVSTANSAADSALSTATALFTQISDEVSDTLSSTITTSTVTMSLMMILIIVAILVSITFGVLIDKAITVPLGHLVRWMDQAGETGNLVFSDADKKLLKSIGEEKDEVGECVRAFEELIDQFIYYSDKVTAIANRDLTQFIKTLGDDDTIGHALVGMVSELSGIFGEIRSSSDQVTLGAGQIADGAQTLAQGATEQASAVEQLSTTISEVSTKTIENARMANQAAELSSQIRDSAQKGTAQMDQMMTAVREINEASSNINKVIKVIDDIAFQTNILALNAAVEAARAGSAGKGFAVVAEEVRSLAAKSAEAAKDTGILIESSIEKATFGAKIADETSASLSEIVGGINESTEIIQNIASGSEQQSEAIRQISIGIDQVADVVQRNSATAQESAAASEEMSGQSSMLNEMIGRFKLPKRKSVGGKPTQAALPKITASSQVSPAVSTVSGEISNDNFGKY
ncbi:MAG: methyl-accepting chemotaxis protein [Oscillospiraceae bacterium]|jgi:methyl-accepting chemotaxis protein|nr:methyl-accepting chemotaxis protein [Oscillospiraceae bacterium]